jgi:hypothetical protein
VRVEFDRELPRNRSNQPVLSLPPIAVFLLDEHHQTPRMAVVSGPGDCQETGGCCASNLAGKLQQVRWSMVVLEQKLTVVVCSIITEKK